jgi:hypothetical protein
VTLLGCPILERLTGMRRPNAFIVGAPRCGTSAMQSYLSRHPDIFFPNVKESHHFANDLINKNDYYSSTDNYLRLFARARNERIVGEASVFYLYSKLASRNIHDFDSRAKVLVMLRNPTDMIRSYHAELVYKGDETILDFHDAFFAEERRKRGELMSENIRFPQKLFYREVAQLCEQLQRYFDVFGKDSIHVIIYDDFKESTAKVFRDALIFLEVEPNFQTDFPVINACKRARSTTLRDLLGAPPQLTKHLRNAIPPKTVRRRMFQALQRLNVKYEPGVNPKSETTS